MPSHRNFTLGMVGHPYHILVKFECQGHWVKVQVTWLNELLDSDSKLIYYDQVMVLVKFGPFREVGGWGRC